MIVLAADGRARELVERPAWITGIAHRVDSANLGARDLTASPSTAATAATGAGADGVEIAELHTPFTHQELLLRRELALGDDVLAGDAGRALAHATGGPALQQNLVCVLDGESR